MQLKSILNRIVLAVCLCAAFIAPQLPAPVAASATVIYVNDNATGFNNGSTWANAYTSLQAAINDGNSGIKEIWVAAGKYVPTTRLAPALARSETFQLKPGSKIYGGFAGMETALSQRNPAANLTILSGDIDNNDSQSPITDMDSVTGNTTNAFHVVMGADAILDGFTITGGYADGSNNNTCNPAASHFCGGGLWNISANTTVANVTFSGNYGKYGGGMANTSSNPTLTNVVFNNNSSGNNGGGMLSIDSDPTLTSVSFNNNYARNNGGGMLSQGGSATLTKVTFTNNTNVSSSALGNAGGAIALSDSNLTVNDGIFSGNSSHTGGGAIAALSGSSVITLTNVIFSANVAGSIGGGVYVQDNTLTITNGLFSGNQAASASALGIGGTSTLTNVTITGNKATGSGTNVGIAIWSGGTHQIRNSIIWDNGPKNFSLYVPTTISYSLLQGGCPSGATCDHITTSDPLFTTPLNYAAAPSSAGDFHLLPTSPAIDAGNNDVISPALPTNDLDGKRRRMNFPGVVDTGNGLVPIVDLGVYEFPSIAPDLTISPAHDAGATPQVGTPFNWILTVSNPGNDAANFSNDQTVLQDALPPSSLATYGTPVVQNISGLSGALNCAIASDILTCTANGAVSLAAYTGQFIVQLPVTPTAAGTLTNPAGAGVCSVDPDSNIVESNESNNTCTTSSLTIGRRIPTLAATMHNSAHTIITSGPIGSTVHGNIQLSDSAGYTPVPDGQVNVRVYAGLACQGTPLSAEDHTLSASGQTDSGPYTLTGSFSYEVDYLGDAIYNPVSKTCTNFLAYQAGSTLTVNTLLDTSGDGLCTDLHCTLREAITAANNLTGDNTILFSVEGTITLASALPHVTKTSGVTIDAQTRRITVSGASSYRILYVNPGGRLTLDHLTLANGSATDGGGVRNEGNLVVTNSLFLNNQATGVGGAIANATSSAVTHVSNTTFSGNGAPDGSAISNQGGSLTVTHSTFAGSDTSGSVLYSLPASISTVTNSLFARGMATLNCNIAPTSASNNLADDTSCGGSPATLGLGSLGDHSGPTQTYALLFDSPAIDAGAPANCTTVDQRDQPRNDWQCDIGALEMILTDSPQIKRNITGPGVYTFGPTLVKLDFTSIGDLKSGLVEYHNGPYPGGQTGASGSSGVGWGPYYTLSGQGDSGTVNTGFVTQLTLPLSLPRPSADDPIVCKYLGSGWNCSRTGRDAQWVWRDAVDSFSDWTVGEHTTPTAIRLTDLSASSQSPSTGLLLGLLAVLAGVVVWRKHS